MKDFHFGSKDESKPSYYVFIKASQNIGEHAFFRYDTMKEAIALFEYQRAMHPNRSLSLGVHKDYSRRADIVEQIDGVAVLSDDYKRFSPWKEDASIATAAQEAAERLEVKWKIDRRLVGLPILIPREAEISSYVPWYLEGRTLRPDDPDRLDTSIVEAYIKDIGWTSFEDVRALANNRGYFNPDKLMVSEYLVSYQENQSGAGGTMAISPGEYEYLAKKTAMERSKVTGRDQDSLDSLKQKAKDRARKTQLVTGLSSERPQTNPLRHEALR